MTDLFRLTYSIYLIYLFIVSYALPFEDLNYIFPYRLKITILLVFVLASRLIVSFFGRLVALVGGTYRFLTLFPLILIITSIFLGLGAGRRFEYIIGGINTVPTIYSLLCLFSLPQLLCHIQQKSIINLSSSIIWFDLNRKHFLVVGFVSFVLSILASSRTSFFILLLTFFAYFVAFQFNRIKKIFRFLLSRSLLLQLGALMILLMVMLRSVSIYILIGIDYLFGCVLPFKTFDYISTLSGLDSQYICSLNSVRMGIIQSSLQFELFGVQISKYSDSELAASINNGGLIALGFSIVLFFLIFKIVSNPLSLSYKFFYLISSFGPSMLLIYSSREIFNSVFTALFVVIFMRSYPIAKLSA